jgi:hypothetical protein
LSPSNQLFAASGRAQDGPVMGMQRSLQFFQPLMKKAKQLFVRKLACGRNAAWKDLVQYRSRTTALWLLMALVLALRRRGRSRILLPWLAGKPQAISYFLDRRASF